MRGWSVRVPLKGFEVEEGCEESVKIMRQRSRWKMLWILVMIFHMPLCSCVEDESIDRRNVQKSLFSPRMDYNQWKPLGRGDPLQNDPTFDYVPPVLDHVHYWVEPKPKEMEPNKGGQKSEILLLGVSSKKPATHNASDRKDILYEPFPKYYHQDKGTSYYPNQPTQRISRPNYLPSMTSQVIPSLMSLATQVLNRTLFSKVAESRMPYTVLMPPPIFTKDPGNSHTTPMTPKPTYEPFTRKHQQFSPPGVTVQESNLIYQASSLGNRKEFEAVPSLSWELSSSTEALSPPKSFIKIQFAPQNFSNKILEASGSNHNVNFVTPPPLDDSKLTFKGHVSDDNDISDSYVRIEKPQAQMDHGGVDISNIHPMPIVFPNAEPFGNSNKYYHPVSMETIRDMETMKPPPPTQSPVYTRPTNPVVNILKKEHVDFTKDFSATKTYATTPKLESYPTDANTVEPELLVTTQDPVITTSVETTTIQTLTTDPLFRHYKQRMEPIKGPLYLIIQGHSKVKTYKPAKQIGGVMVQDTNEIPHDANVDYSIKHLHGFGEKEDLIKKSENIAKRRQARTGNLLTLKHVVQTGLGAIDFIDGEMLRRSDLKETELEAGYKVVDNKDVTSEKYMKGIVEAARKLE
ncbi:uncharacterized protein [Euwallacea similis]|uniref:uncharacterized protein n=1 Tax=Euwallacea similis TaxID=1736056 RepID=UPI00344E655A